MNKNYNELVTEFNCTRIEIGKSAAIDPHHHHFDCQTRRATADYLRKKAEYLQHIVGCLDNCDLPEWAECDWPSSPGADCNMYTTLGEEFDNILIDIAESAAINASHRYFPADRTWSANYLMKQATALQNIVTRMNSGEFMLQPPSK